MIKKAIKGLRHHAHNKGFNKYTGTYETLNILQYNATIAKIDQLIYSAASGIISIKQKNLIQLDLSIIAPGMAKELVTLDFVTDLHSHLL